MIIIFKETEGEMDKVDDRKDSPQRLRHFFFLKNQMNILELKKMQSLKLSSVTQFSSRWVLPGAGISELGDRPIEHISRLKQREPRIRVIRTGRNVNCVGRTQEV